MTIACFCGHVFESSRSTACSDCGEPILMRESYESPSEFEERMASHRRSENEIRALPETPHPAEIMAPRVRDAA